MYEKYIVKDRETLRKIKDGLLATYFAAYDKEFLLTEAGQEDIDANVFQRYNNSLRHVVPWVADKIDLAGKTLVEIGCGTGSSTAAFSPFVDKIYGYDIHAGAVAGARARMEAMGIENTTLAVIAGDDLVSVLAENHGAGVDVMLLFAVLEHQTARERIKTLQTCWRLLKSGGLLVVSETPNLLQYFDYHTSQLPFLHLLPTDVYTRYVVNSPRCGFNESFLQADSLSHEEVDLAITRMGRGCSYHDFELGLGKEYNQYIVANGFEEEVLVWTDISLEEELLRYYVQAKGFDIPLGLTRFVLNLIFQKGGQVTPVGNSNVPDFSFIANKYDVIQMEIRVKGLEAKLNDIINSRRWKLINTISWPYRYLKTRLFG